MHAVAVRVLVKLVSLVDAGHQEVGVATLRGVLLLQVQIQQLTRSIIVLLGHLSGSLALRLVCILDKAARPREQGNLPLAVGIVVALLLREHHVDVDNCSFRRHISGVDRHLVRVKGLSVAPLNS